MRLLHALVLCTTLIALPAGAQEVIPPDWRSGNTALDARDFEVLAKQLVYEAGRARPAQGVDDEVAIRDDTVFADDLAINDLRLVDDIDLDNGFQAVLIEDTRTGDRVIVMRGTELTSGGIVEAGKDVASDMSGVLSKELAVGRNQYAAAQEALHAWVDDNAQAGIRTHVVGHSLGGAHAQRLLLDRAGKIESARVYNAPGLETGEVERITTEPGLMENLHGPDGRRKLAIFNTRTDVVGRVGGPHVLGDVFIAEGGDTDRSLHNGFILGTGAYLRPVSYAMYQMTKGRGFHLDTGSSITIDFFGQWVNYHFADAQHLFEVIQQLQKDEVQYRRELANPALKEKRLQEEAAHWALLDELNFFQSTDETSAPTLVAEPVDPDLPEVSAAPALPAPTPVEPVPGKTPRPKRDPVAGGTLEIKPAAPMVAPAAEVLVSGSFTGDISGNNGKSLTFEGGQISFDITDNAITGSATGTVVNREGDYYGTDVFTGRITGSYDPASGKVKGTIVGQAGIMDELEFSYVGQGDQSGFFGDWEGDFGMRGEWSSAPVRVRTITAQEANCTGPNRDYWISQGEDCSKWPNPAPDNR
ncbi:MAG: alpha/beta hydrolase [Paracoccaceae bacterium]|nr:alpha/beta hydrolase [Paracoccaceae bacterium]